MSDKIRPPVEGLSGPDLKCIGDQLGFKTLLTLHLQRAEVSPFIPAVRIGNYSVDLSRDLESGQRLPFGRKASNLVVKEWWNFR